MNKCIIADDNCERCNGCNGCNLSLLKTFKETFKGLELDDSLKKPFNGIIDVVDIEYHPTIKPTIKYSYKTDDAVISNYNTGLALRFSVILELESELESEFGTRINEYSHNNLGHYRSGATIVLNGELTSKITLEINKHLESLKPDILKMMRLIHLNDSENKYYVNRPADYAHMLVNECIPTIDAHLNKYIEINYPEVLIWVLCP